MSEGNGRFGAGAVEDRGGEGALAPGGPFRRAARNRFRRPLRPRRRLHLERALMANEKNLKPVSSYIEFGLRLHKDDFTQLTAAVLLVYLPLSALALFFLPLEQIQGGSVTVSSAPGILLYVFFARVIQTFIFILVILKVHLQLKGEENVWDVSGALSRLVRVATVDLAYVLALALAVQWISFLLMIIFFGGSVGGRVAALVVSVFVVAGPAVRYYFCTFSAMFHAKGFGDSFRIAGAISAGSERLVIFIFLIYTIAWSMIWWVFQKWWVLQNILGGGIFGNIVAQAAIMVASLSYFFATYRLYLDLTLAEANRLANADEGDAAPRPFRSGSNAGRDGEDASGESRRPD